MIFISEIQQRLLESPLIVEKVGPRIYGYRAGENNDTSNLYVIIRPLGPPAPEKPVSDNFMAESHLVKVDVEGADLLDVQAVQNEIRKIMHSFGLRQMPDGLDEFFDATKHYVDSRNYSGIPNEFYYKSKLI
ncbi:hypothetical protein [Salinicoccus carnicancri]|uniref:hypothetical protein n=1 Tax=Salinicoccus carnicancri TaxID=558170 RepID=UPI0003705D93|nr:hypothetical protein [Salinicoccus carnicancri]